MLSLGIAWVNIRSGNESELWNHVKAKEPHVSLDRERQDGRPPLSDLLFRIDENHSEIIGDVDWLMDYAIVGHSKTATSDIMRWLCKHPEVLGYRNEVRSLYHRRPDELVELLYNLPAGRNIKRGYKHPLDIVFNYTTDYFREYWPSTRLIVGVRHPVKWFESWYNFRVRLRGENFRGNDTSVDPLTLVGKRLPFQMFYHRHLAMLGKTSSHGDPGQLKLLAAVTGMRFPTRPVSPNKVFLYDVSQPFDRDPARNGLFRRELQQFLGLSEPLNPLETRSSRNYHYALDICEDKYKDLRSDIVKVGEAASEWIVTYFIDHPDVTVPCKEQFTEVLRTWSSDPCTDGHDEKDSAPTNLTLTIPIPFVSDNTSDGQQSISPPSWPDLGRPSLHELVNGSDIRPGADVQFLLDFAMVGHAKTATTYMMKWIAAHDDVLMFREEIHFLTTGMPGLFVKKMYSLPAGSRYKRGYKAPNDISRRVPRGLLRTHFSHTDLIVGIRHPVKWFESWYNFNMRKDKATANPDVYYYAHERNLPYQIKFHVYLALMGKTNFLQSNDEIALLRPYLSDMDASSYRARMDHRVFIYDVSQPFDRNMSRSAKFRQDLSDYLGLSSTLPPVEVRNASRNFHYSIDVCEERFVPIRQNLLRFGKAASTWMLNYFLDLEDVIVSDKEHVAGLLRSWEHDPCVALAAKG